MRFLIAGIFILIAELAISESLVPSGERVIETTCKYSPSRGGCLVDAFCGVTCVKKVTSFEEHATKENGSKVEIVSVKKDAYRQRAVIKYKSRKESPK